LQALLLQEEELKLLAHKAIRAYVKAIRVAHDKKVFDVESLDLEGLARSYGLATIPVLRSKKESDKEDKNKLRAKEKLKRTVDVMEKGESSGRLVLKAKKEGKTAVDRLLKRKPQKGLADEAQKLIANEDDESGDDDVLVRKKGSQAHTMDIDEIAPISTETAAKIEKQKAKKLAKRAGEDTRTLDDLGLEEDMKTRYYEVAKEQLREHDTIDRQRLKERLYVERQKKKQQERDKEQERHGGDQRDKPMVTLANPLGDDEPVPEFSYSQEDDDNSGAQSDDSDSGVDGDDSINEVGALDQDSEEEVKPSKRSRLQMEEEEEEQEEAPAKRPKKKRRINEDS